MQRKYEFHANGNGDTSYRRICTIYDYERIELVIRLDRRICYLEGFSEKFFRFLLLLLLMDANPNGLAVELDSQVVRMMSSGAPGRKAKVMGELTVKPALNGRVATATVSSHQQW